MKKIILITIVILVSINSYSSNNDLFTYDKAKINNEFKELSYLENYIIDNDYPVLSEININSMNLNISDFNLKNPLGSLMWEDMDWGSFAWGFCCCPVGFFVVAVNPEKDDLAKQSYWTGVIIGTILNLISSAFTNTYYYSY